MNDELIKVVRPQQWIKNLFVFLPLIFGGELLHPVVLQQAAVTFVVFSLAASSIYCFNDLMDVDYDRQHPVKCHRPLASGAVSLWQARMAMALLLMLAVAGGQLLSPAVRWQTLSVVGIYYLTNLAYSSGLKRYAILDVCIVACGFVLRIMAGGTACQVTPSQWIVLMTFLITLFLSFAKRRDDVLRMIKTGEAPRANTSRYNLTFINQAITITASVTLVCYIMYTMAPEVTSHFHTDHLYLTSIFVLLGLLRYIQLTVVDELSGDPTKVIIHDRPILLIVAGWLLSFLLIIYG